MENCLNHFHDPYIEKIRCGVGFFPPVLQRHIIERDEKIRSYSKTKPLQQSACKSHLEASREKIFCPTGLLLYIEVKQRDVICMFVQTLGVQDTSNPIFAFGKEDGEQFAVSEKGEQSDFTNFHSVEYSLKCSIHMWQKCTASRRRRVTCYRRKIDSIRSNSRRHFR
jgi:hypothetical protein